MSTWIPLIATVPNQFSTTAVLGYLDPGTGSMLLQVLIAGLFSSLFFAKSSFLYVRDALFARRKKV